MDNRQIDVLVNAVLARMKKNVLLILTPANGYEDDIYQRFKQCQHLSFSAVITDQATMLHCAEKWQKIANLIATHAELNAHLESTDVVLLPFLDMKTLSSLAQGNMHHPIVDTIQYALMKGIPVMAFCHNCDPESELNQVRGLNHSKSMTALIQQYLTKTAQMGVHYLTVNQFCTQIDCVYGSQRSASTTQTNEQRYITLNDITNKAAASFSRDMKLTDLAKEYISKNNLTF